MEMFRVLNSSVKKQLLHSPKVVINLGKTPQKGNESVGVDLSAWKNECAILSILLKCDLPKELIHL